ncbi:MAG: DNA polymerase III subunit delta [Anaerorhabdus sp.]
MNYLLIGSEEYLLKKELNKLIDSFDIENKEMNITFFDATDKEFSIETFLEVCNTIPFFSNKKTVVLKNPIFLSASGKLQDKDVELLENYMKNYNNDCELIFYGNTTLDKRKKIVKFIQKNSESINVNPLSENDFKMYVRKEIKKNKISSSEKAISLLADKLPNDLSYFHNELNKLLVFNGDINEKVIEDLIIFPLENDVFNLINAVVANKISDIFMIWKQLKELNTEPIHLIYLLSSQFRFLYQIKYYLNIGYDEFEIKNIINAHPYRIKLAINTLKLLSIDRCLKILNELAETDQGIKDGKLDKNKYFELLLIKIGGHM